MPKARRSRADREHFWRDAIAAWKTSGQTVRAFCAARGVSEARFFARRRELTRRDHSRQPAPAPSFVAVRVIPEPTAEVVLPTGLVVEPALYTFATIEGVEPTNNAAERALRHAVCWRKTSYGTDSAHGSRFVERVLTAVATCRKQGRDALAFLTTCCQAARGGTELPSLLPAAATPPLAGASA